MPRPAFCSDRYIQHDRCGHQPAVARSDELTLAGNLTGNDVVEDTRVTAHDVRNTELATMTDFTATDYFSDQSVAADTYPYFDFLLEGRRVWRAPYHGVVLVAGHEEVLAVLRDTASFSSCNIVAGPNFRFPVELTGDDVTGLVEQHRDALPM